MGESESVPLSFTSWERYFTDLPASVLCNRYFEQNPLQAEQAALLARPGTAELGVWGEGNIRGFFSAPGLFDGALFLVSGEILYRVETDLSSISITGVIFGTGAVSMTGVKGAGYERLFIADGSHLQVYQGGLNATGVLTGSAQPSEGDTINIGGTYYQWTDPDTSGEVSNGAGNSSNPWKVNRGASLADALENMVKAITFTGTAGVTYSANLGGQNIAVTAEVSDTAETMMTVTAKTDLASGNAIVTTVISSDTAPVISWGGATLSGGGVHGLSGVEIPDGLPPVSVATLKSYILVAIGNSQRFFYIKPAELVIDDLSFAEAESQPDDTLEVISLGDTAMFIGEDSTEAWYATGNADSPFAPVSGRVYDRGAIEGTIVNVKGTVFLVGPDNVVYSIGGSAGRVSNHGVEEMIRLALGA